MKTFRFVIQDPQGIHARPAGLFIKEASQYASSVTIDKNGKQADGKKIFAVMGLGAKKGEEIQVTVEGSDEEQAAAALEAFLKTHL